MLRVLGQLRRARLGRRTCVPLLPGEKATGAPSAQAGVPSAWFLGSSSFWRAVVAGSAKVLQAGFVVSGRGSRKAGGGCSLVSGHVTECWGKESFSRCVTEV